MSTSSCETAAAQPDRSAAPGTPLDAADELRAGFLNPPTEYRPAPFWWWVGEPLDRERLAWQLDALKSKGIFNAVVSYNHRPDGSAEPGDPPVFSAAWWELFRWMVAECRRRGMRIGVQDYTLLNPLLQRIGRETPEMDGGELKEISQRLTRGETSSLHAAAGHRLVAAGAYPLRDETASPEGRIDLSGAVSDGALHWRAPEGEWLVSIVCHSANPFDPMHPTAGAKAIEAYYAPFEANCPGELGRTISVLFQDELDFGAGMPLWSNRMADEFRARKGYELPPLLPALWHDLGPVTAKLRIDYADVVVTLLEEHYFAPIYRWANERGVMLGNDNAGRGAIEAGRNAYGDYFRTMRWFTAPGTDDPRVQGPRAFKGLKVNSSIAHLYERPRVWCEGFHSSGWGATPAELIAAMNEEFAYGATLINLHGLYYSTYGSWWEWAPPDFHFRQPYWRHMRGFNDYAARLSFLLSQGDHVCDIAILYPITAIEAGLNARLPELAEADVPYSEALGGKAPPSLDAAEVHAFGLGRALMDAGIDFDFIDFQSLERAESRDGRLRVAGEAFRVLILPEPSAVRFSTLQRADEFRKQGGVVIAYGCLPRASERAGSGDPEVDRLVAEIFGGDGPARFFPRGYENVKRAVQEAIVRDFLPADDGRLCALHRRVDASEIYYVFNRSKAAYNGEVFFRARGGVEQWNVWTGAVRPLPDGCRVDGGTRLRIALGPGESTVIVFDSDRDDDRDDDRDKNEDSRHVRHGSQWSRFQLDGEWECELEPTMDNRHGDFRLPARDGMVGAEARRFRYMEEDAPEPSAACNQVGQPFLADPVGQECPTYSCANGVDDSGWPLTTCSFGPRFLVLGPFPPGGDPRKLEERLATLVAIDPAVPVECAGRAYAWRPYEMSLRWGIENDPFLKDWAGGPHGLKKAVPDEFIDLFCDAPGSVWYLWSTVPSVDRRTVRVMAGSRSAYAAWLNGRRVLSQDQALPPGRHPVWNLPHYDSQPRQTAAALNAGANPLLLRFEQPAGQRVRAYVAFDPPAANGQLGLRWFSGPGQMEFDCYPNRRHRVGWYRFASPPGLTSFRATIYGRGPRAWVGGREVRLTPCGDRGAGAMEYRADIPDPVAGQVAVALRVELRPGSFAGDAVPAPIRMECGRGRLRMGDWSQYGLASYSGIVRYRRAFTLSRDQVEKTDWTLGLGRVAGTAAVWVNGRPAGTLLAPPWQLEVDGMLVEGENTVEVAVGNTLANHYSIGIPTPYVYPGQTVSGLLGPVRMEGSLRRLA